MDRADYSDILAGVKEGRFGAETARRMLEIRAHSHRQALQDAHDALDNGHRANYAEDEFKSLFPPTGPHSLGPDDDEDEQHITLPNRSKMYPGNGQGHKNRQPTKQASAPGDDDDAADYAHLYPPRTVAEVEARHREREVQAGRVLDYDDNELYRLLFPGEA